jgi:hypothetical protein
MPTLKQFDVKKIVSYLKGTFFLDGFQVCVSLEDDHLLISDRWVMLNVPLNLVGKQLSAYMPPEKHIEYLMNTEGLLEKADRPRIRSLWQQCADWGYYNEVIPTDILLQQEKERLLRKFVGVHSNAWINKCSTDIFGYMSKDIDMNCRFDVLLDYSGAERIMPVRVMFNPSYYLSRDDSQWQPIALLALHGVNEKLADYIF